MSVARFIHLGDLHLHPGPRQVDRLAALDQVVAEGRQLPHLAAWLWPGDLFHARSTIEDRNLLAARLLLMADRAPVLICPGNHDQAGDLDIFGELAGGYAIRVVTDPGVVTLTLATNDVGPAAIFVLPWPQQTTTVAFVALMEEAARQLEAARAKGWPTLMLGHANVRGARRGPGQPEIGAEAELDASLLNLLGDCPKLLNHIHIAQAIGGAHYAGSLCRLSWGEVEPKSYTVVEMESRGAISTYRIVRHPLAVPPLYHVEGWLTREGLTDLDVTAGPEGESLASPPSWAGCDVRLRARYHQSAGLVLADAQAQAKAQFTAARRFEFEPVCVPDRGLRAPAVAQAKTFAEKLTAWAEVAGVVLANDIEAKADKLEQPDAEAVVAGVEAHMAALVDLTVASSDAWSAKRAALEEGHDVTAGGDLFADVAVEEL